MDSDYVELMRDNVSRNWIIKLLKVYIWMFIEYNVKQTEP